MVPTGRAVGAYDDHLVLTVAAASGCSHDSILPSGSDECAARCRAPGLNRVLSASVPLVSLPAPGRPVKGGHRMWRARTAMTVLAAGVVVLGGCGSDDEARRRECRQPGVPRAPRRGP